ncbi:hypothetical protein PILCRDRAFT_709654 [Piloderma croceum F 1598]|uniref:Uncharacterized protein n=1 Tax=Piloderma croceum (strain F 1598) TaxID=765440 RepID=A0A0C3F2F1_PILCF|nr:hypothetical protein PILCRDRAFT_709654 [Piloderma croceum F 1598]
MGQRHGLSALLHIRGEKCIFNENGGAHHGRRLPRNVTVRWFGRVLFRIIQIQLKKLIKNCIYCVGVWHFLASDTDCGSARTLEDRHRSFEQVLGSSITSMGMEAADTPRALLCEFPRAIHLRIPLRRSHVRTRPTGGFTSPGIRSVDQSIHQLLHCYTATLHHLCLALASSLV